MSDTTVVTTDETEIATSLPDRLDAAIGDASSGIGVMMSELVRRSLRTGVADIERTLTDVTAEKVDLAIELQMPAISETAHRVAETTSARIVKSVVTEAEERSHEQLQTAVTHFEDAIKQTNEESRQSVARTSEDIAKLESRAQSSWKKVKSHFALVDSEFQKAKSRIAQISTAERETQEQLTDVTRENVQLKRNVDELAQKLSDLSTKSQQDLQLVLEQNQMLQQRLEQLEKPKGLKAVWQKLRRGKKKQADALEGPEE